MNNDLIKKGFNKKYGELNPDLFGENPIRRCFIPNDKDRYWSLDLSKGLFTSKKKLKKENGYESCESESEFNLNKSNFNF